MKGLSQSFSYFPFKYWKALKWCFKDSLEPFLLWAEQPESLSLSSHERCSTPLICFVTLLWTSSSRTTSLCWGPHSGHRTSGEVSEEQSKGTESPPSTSCPHCFWCTPGHGWLSGLQNIGGSCWASHQSTPKTFSCWAREDSDAQWVISDIRLLMRASDIYAQ